MNETVSLVGRTNVGKSSLFNKLIKSKSAIVSNHEGLTRDIKVAELQYFNKAVNLVDTGGFFTSKDDEFEDLIIAKAYEAIEQSDKVIFVVDKKFGLSPYDKAIANIVRKSGKRSLLVINKIDVKTDEGIEIFYELGFNDFVTVSAEHNLNIDALVEKIFEDIKEHEKDDAHSVPRISIIGKPNVGKSSSINAILKEDKMIVSDIPGTTIDSVDTRVEFKGKEYIFADTAGIRRKNKTTEKEEKFSVIKSLNAVEEANLCLVFQDASDCLKEQDLKIVERAKEVAESKRLQGMGIADQRREIARGLEESVEVLNKSGINSQEASALIVITQHYDTLQSIGADTNSNLILLPNNPNAASDMLNDMVTSLVAANKIQESSNIKKEEK